MRKLSASPKTPRIQTHEETGVHNLSTSSNSPFQSISGRWQRIDWWQKWGKSIEDSGFYPFWLLDENQFEFHLAINCFVCFYRRRETWMMKGQRLGSETEHAGNKMKTFLNKFKKRKAFKFSRFELFRDDFGIRWKVFICRFKSYPILFPKVRWNTFGWMLVP